MTTAKTKVYIVIVSTGSYDEREQWIAKVFSDEGKAIDYCDVMEKKARELTQWYWGLPASERCSRETTDRVDSLRSEITIPNFYPDEWKSITITLSYEEREVEG